MKKLIVHIGYPKTATTTLQYNLFRALHEEGKIEWLHGNSFFNDNSLLNFPCENILDSLTGQEVNDRRQGLLEKEYEKLKEIQKNISVISDESLAFKFPGFSWAKSEDAFQNAEKLKNLFSPIFDDIKIIIGVRAQYSIIQSFYVQCYTLITNEIYQFKDIGKYVQENFLSSRKSKFLNYEEMLEEYSRVFGENNVHVLIFEDLINNHNTFYSTLSNILNIDQFRIQSLMGSSAQNSTSKSKSGYLAKKNTKFYRIILNPSGKILHNLLGKKFYRRLRNIYISLIPKKLRQQNIEIRTLTQLEKKQIQRKFAHSNLKMIKKFNLPVDKMRTYGYLN